MTSKKAAGANTLESAYSAPNPAPDAYSPDPGLNAPGPSPGASAPDPAGPAAAPDEQALDAALEAQVTSMGQATAAALKTFPQERVLIPVDQLNKHDKFVVVGVNGWIFQIERDTPVTLPRPVVELLEQGGYKPLRVR